jgi:hypothetical protein
MLLSDTTHHRTAPFDISGTLKFISTSEAFQA